jgi:DNA-binding response OmpR family regulator
MTAQSRTPPARKPLILVADDDEWIVTMVSAMLAKQGYEVIGCADGKEALHEAGRRTPDLLITDVMMPGLDGWELVRTLRSRPQLALTPVIFLTALGGDDDRLRGFRLGADDYVPKPFRFEELELRVANALRRRVQVEATLRAQVAREPGPRDPRGIHGTLDQLGVSAMLMVMEMEKKSGVLVFMSPAGETARVFLKQGRVVRARLDGKPAPKNAELIYRILRWADGKFEFSALDVDMANELDASTTALLVEGARRLDEELAAKPQK